MLVFGADQTITNPRQSEINLLLYTDFAGGVSFSCDKAGLRFETQKTVMSGKNTIPVTIKNRGLTYQITASFGAESDTVTIDIQKNAYSLSLSDIKADLVTAIQNITPTQTERVRFKFEDVFAEEKLLSLSDRFFFVELTEVIGADIFNARQATYSVMAKYSDFKENDIDDIDLQLQSFLWRQGIVSVKADNFTISDFGDFKLLEVTVIITYFNNCEV